MRMLTSRDDLDENDSASAALRARARTGFA